MAETIEQTTPKIHIMVNNQTFDLSTDSPSLDALIDYVVTHRGVDYNQIRVTCDGDDFDVESFKIALIEEITELLKDIQMNENDLERALDSIPD